MLLIAYIFFDGGRWQTWIMDKGSLAHKGRETLTNAAAIYVVMSSWLSFEKPSIWTPTYRTLSFSLPRPSWSCDWKALNKCWCSVLATPFMVYHVVSPAGRRRKRGMVTRPITSRFFRNFTPNSSVKAACFRHIHIRRALTILRQPVNLMRKHATFLML